MCTRAGRCCAGACACCAGAVYLSAGAWSSRARAARLRAGAAHFRACAARPRAGAEVFFPGAHLPGRPVYCVIAWRDPVIQPLQPRPRGWRCRRKGRPSPFLLHERHNTEEPVICPHLAGEGLAALPPAPPSCFDGSRGVCAQLAQAFASTYVAHQKQLFFEGGIGKCAHNVVVWIRSEMTGGHSDGQPSPV
jgi:hypothetical protein